ncbi:MAG TPA: hypothetical protein VK208_20095 [Pyrinomonadaceae bacterium]|jgi:hypothetical protein|nr:hypothetical protein [Pyrinomonadaceae bacterium]
MSIANRQSNLVRRAPAKKPAAGLFTLLALITGVVGIVVLQAGVSSQQGRTEIVSDDFTQPRPTPTPKPEKFGRGLGRIAARPTASVAAVAPKDESKHYRLASSPETDIALTLGSVEQLGVTLWRLRPATPSDPGQRMLVRETGKSSNWVPERIEADTPVSEGDYLRLSVESPQTGFLYVVDRDVFADGSLGEPLLIFPTLTTRAGDNHVGPGKLIDIPAQEDDPGYYTARPTRSDQIGEMLTLIVTEAPLELPISEKPLQLSKVQISDWQRMWGGRSERFEMEGGAGTAWTKEERAAAAIKGRQLTRDDPAPQTIYRVTTADKKGLLVNVQLLYKRPAQKTPGS